MNADELRRMANEIENKWASVEDSYAAADYLRACADALEKGPVAWTWPNGELLSDDQTDPMWKTGDAVALYPVAMPARAHPLRLPKPMTYEELWRVWCSTTSANSGLLEVQNEVLRRVKEANK